MLNNSLPPSMPQPLYYKVVCYFSTSPSKDKAKALENGIGRYMGLFTTYSEALNASKPFEGRPDYVGRFIGELWTQEEANNA